MRWRKTFLAEITEKVSQLGLTSCPVCRSETLFVNRWPVMMEIGALHNGKNEGDEEHNILFMVGIECSVCGHVMLFNSERFRSGDTKVLVRGLTEAEEDEAEERDMWQ